MEKVKIKLNKGCSLWHPVTNKLLGPETELEVELNTFWRRRVKDRSVTLITKSKAYKNLTKNLKPAKKLGGE